MRDWSSDVCSSDLFGRVATVILVPVDGRDLLFEVVDRLGARRGVLFAREGQDVFEMLEVSGLQLGVPLIFLQVEIAVGHADAALEHRIDVNLGILVVLPYIAPEEMLDAAAVGFGEQLGEARLVDGADLVQTWLARVRKSTSRT